MAEIDQRSPGSARSAPSWPAWSRSTRSRHTRTRPRVAGGASKSSPETGGDSDGGMPQLRLPLRPAALPDLRLRRVEPPHSGNDWHGDGSLPLPCRLLGPPRGHIRATNDRTVADNSGHHRLVIRPAHRAFPPSAAGRRGPPGLSRTEEVAWASIRAGVCAATGTRGHRRSPTLHGLKQQISLRSPRSLTRKFRGPLLRTVGRRTPTYFCGIPLQIGPSHPRRTRQTCSIAHPNQTKNPPGHPSLRGAADSSRLPPL